VIKSSKRRGASRRPVILARAFAVAGVLLAAATAPAYGESPAPTAPTVQASAPDTELLSAAAVREDLDQLYMALQEAHYDLYARRSRSEYDRLHRQLRASIAGPQSRLAAARIMQRFLAFGRIAHANTNALYTLASAHRAQGGRFVPLYVQFHGPRLLLSETADDAGTLRAGTELLALNGKPVKWWREQLGRYVSADNAYLEAAQLEGAFPVMLWVELGDVHAVDVKALRPDGKLVNARVAALSRTELADLRKKHPTPELATDFHSREYRLLDSRVAYLRPGPFYNAEAEVGATGPSYENSKYQRFIDDAFAQMIAAGATDLLIDLRSNPGGDNSFSDPMIAWFADRPFRFAHRFMLKASAATKAHYQKLRDNGIKEEGVIGDLMRAEAAQANGQRYAFPIAMVEPRPAPRFTGRVFVLQDRQSYSNAASVSALIQDYKFGTILGEETADLVSTFGSTVPLQLRNSAINVSFPKSRITRLNGDERPRGVLPDIAIPPPLPGVSDDVMLASALATIRAGQREGKRP